MSQVRYTAFYPSCPYWACNKPDFAAINKVEWLRKGDWFFEQMSEEVYSRHDDRHSLKICRDGQILVRMAHLEENAPNEELPSIERERKRWGEYLDYLNAFYLFLDSATAEIDRIAHFNIHEITSRDAFRVTYKNGKWSGEHLSVESVASAFQHGRHLCNYRANVPIEFDTRISSREVVSQDAISLAAERFEKAIPTPDLIKSLASFTKSISEYKIGNYETCCVLAWFIIEAALGRVWRSHLEALNATYAGGRKRINRERYEFLTGRDMSMSVVSNMLELFSVIDHDIFINVDTVRGYRNKIVHARNFAPGATEASLSMRTALDMINKLWGVSFTPNFSYSVPAML